MKLHILYFLLFCGVLIISPTSYIKAQTKREPGLKTVVLDAGHGGKDAGCVRNGVLEKNINLKLALLLGNYITNNFSDVKVIYTRKTDVFIEVQERGNIANKANADLFISIHVDAVKSTSPSGSSTYVMGIDKSNANLDVAMRENDVINYEENFTTKYEGYVPGSTESFIIFSLMQYAYINQSMNFAEMIQKHYSKNTPINNRGVKQAGLLVLWKTAMPSVLTEIGFMSNASDRAFLTTEAGQKKIATSLFNAFSEYKSKVEGSSNVVKLDIDSVKEQNTAAIEQPVKQIEERPIELSNSEIKYMIQISASKVKLNTNSSYYGKYRGTVTEKRIGGYYKYYVGDTDSFKKALPLQREVAQKFKGAFIVAFRADEVISITDDMKNR